MSAYVGRVWLIKAHCQGDTGADQGDPDLHEYLGGAKIMPTTPHPITNEMVPLTLGHEFSGVVEEVGQGVYDIKVGAKVTIQPIIYDGTCCACRDGYINCCDNNGFVGLSGESVDPPVSNSKLTTDRLGWWTFRARGRPSKSRV